MAVDLNEVASTKFQSPRSGRQHKAWGGAKRNPGNTPLKKSSESAERPSAESMPSFRAHKLSAAPRALHLFA